jgi:pimeloyl-ACP methyl ester carboxylesterase
MADLRVLRGGGGDPVLLLLHGLGGTGDVWSGCLPLLAQRWPGRWVVPDLPGHGGSAPLPRYTFDGLATAIAPLVAGADRVVVLGHSLGGVVGLSLAGAHRTVGRVIGLGIKVRWSDDDLAKAGALAIRPPAWFDTRDEAAARYLRVSGLSGLVGPQDSIVDSGLREEDGRWRLALDPRAFGVGAPDMAGLLAGTGAAVVLARGEHDPMNTDEQLAALGAATITLTGLGHSAHVEDPAAVLALLDAG